MQPLDIARFPFEGGAASWGVVHVLSPPLTLTWLNGCKVEGLGRCIWSQWYAVLTRKYAGASIALFAHATSQTHSLGDQGTQHLETSPDT